MPDIFWCLDIDYARSGSSSGESPSCRLIEDYLKGLDSYAGNVLLLFPMSEPDLSRHTPVPREEARMSVYIAILMELYKLRWAAWRKGMTVADVLKQTGVDSFADGVTDRLLGGDTVLMRGPPGKQHTADGQGIINP